MFYFSTFDAYSKFEKRELKQNIKKEDYKIFPLV